MFVHIRKDIKKIIESAFDEIIYSNQISVADRSKLLNSYITLIDKLIKNRWDKAGVFTRRHSMGFLNSLEKYIRKIEYQEIRLKICPQMDYVRWLDTKKFYNTNYNKEQKT
jgi:hypothetical protein